VSSEGVLEMGFNQPLSEASLNFFGLSSSFRRLSGSSQVSIEDLIEVALTSTKFGVKSLDVNFRVIDFEGQIAYLELDFEEAINK